MLAALKESKIHGGVGSESLQQPAAPARAWPLTLFELPLVILKTLPLGADRPGHREIQGMGKFI